MRRCSRVWDTQLICSLVKLPGVVGIKTLYLRSAPELIEPLHRVNGVLRAGGIPVKVVGRPTAHDQCVAVASNTLGDLRLSDDVISGYQLAELKGFPSELVLTLFKAFAAS